MMRARRIKEQGYLIIYTMIVIFVMTGIALSAAAVVGSKYSSSKRDISAQSAVYVAEAGVTDAIAELRKATTFTGQPDTARKVLYSDATKGRGEFSSAVTDNGDTTFTVTSTGYHFADRNATSDASAIKRVVRAKLKLNPETVKQNVIAGSGGIVVHGGAASQPFSWYGPSGALINAYSRGKILLRGGGATLGSTSRSVDIMASNIGCGTSATWPQPCGAANPPIQFSDNGAIYGTVCATDQSSSANIYTGPTGQGLVAGCQAPTYKAAEFDKQAFASAMTVPRTGASASCTIGFGGSAKSVTIEPNTVVTGNVTVSGYSGFPSTQNCTLLIKGDVYIKGTLTIGDAGRIRVDDSAGSRKPRIVVNGKVVFDGVNTGDGVYQNASGTPLAILSYWSTDSACTSSDSCTSVSPSVLYNSSYRDMNASDFMSLMGFESKLAIDIRGENMHLNGLIAHSFFGITRYAVRGDVSMYGIGGEGVTLTNCDMTNPFTCTFGGSGIFTVIDSTPFSGVLMRLNYTVTDYQQIY